MKRTTGILTALLLFATINFPSHLPPLCVHRKRRMQGSKLNKIKGGMRMIAEHKTFRHFCQNLLFANAKAQNKHRVLT